MLSGDMLGVKIGGIGVGQYIELFYKAITARVAMGFFPIITSLSSTPYLLALQSLLSLLDP